MSNPHGADSEVGRLRTVMLHRPGPELKRLTPRNNDKLLFDGIPWVSRFSSGPGRCSITVRSRPTSLSAPWGLLMGRSLGPGAGGRAATVACQAAKISYAVNAASSRQTVAPM